MGRVNAKLVKILLKLFFNNKFPQLWNSFIIMNNKHVFQKNIAGVHPHTNTYMLCMLKCKKRKECKKVRNWKTVLHGIFWQVARFSNIVIELLKMPKDMPERAYLSQNYAVPRSLQSTLLLISTYLCTHLHPCFLPNGMWSWKHKCSSFLELS